MSDALPVFITETELRTALKIKSRGTIATMIASGALPPPARIGESRRWSADVLADLAAGRAPWRTANAA